jgi:hypothetical protein
MERENAEQTALRSGVSSSPVKNRCAVCLREFASLRRLEFLIGDHDVDSMNRFLQSDLQREGLSSRRLIRAGERSCISCRDVFSQWLKGEGGAAAAEPVGSANRRDSGELGCAAAVATLSDM